MASLSQLVARVPVISATSKGPLVNLVAWITMTTMCLSVLTVLISKFIMLRKLTGHDAFITFAMLSAVAYVIAISEQVTFGLGSPVNTIAPGTYVSFQKAGYAAQLLYVCALGCAKASTLALLVALSPQKSHRLPMFAVSAFLAAWTLASFFAAAFQCRMPTPYLYTTTTCFAQMTFWTTYGIIDIVTDVAIMLLPVLVVKDLQLSLEKKVQVVFAFSFRLLAVGMAVYRLLELHASLDRSSDLTLHAWTFQIATLLELFFSIFATCVPHLRPFMESIQAGYLSGVLNEGETHHSYGAGGDSYVMSKHGIGARSRTTTAVHATSRSRASVELPTNTTKKTHPQTTRHTSRDVEMARPNIGQALSSDQAVTSVVHHVRHGSDVSEGGKSGASDGSKAMIIKTTKEWTVSYQE